MRGLQKHSAVRNDATIVRPKMHLGLSGRTNQESICEIKKIGSDSVKNVTTHMTEKHSLYQGNVSLEFSPARHLYTVDGIPVDGVTSVLQVISKPALVGWAANMAAEHVEKSLKPGQVMNEMSIKALVNECKLAHRKKKETAADVGTFIHEWVEHFIKTGGEEKHTEHTEITAGVEAFKRWVGEHQQIEFVASEGKIFSRKHNFAGTFDFILVMDGKRYIGDLKTGKAVYPEYFLQTSAYQLARQEEFPEEDYEGHIIVNCRKDGELEICTLDRSDFEKNSKAFLSALDLYRWQKSLNKV